MNTLDAILLIESEENVSFEDYQDAWQSLIDSAAVWSLQGFYQREAVRLIESGVCHAPSWAG